MSDYLSVTSLTKYLKMKFDRDPYLERVYLTGQVSNYRRRPSHQYFSLKDEGAVIQATIWAGVFKKIGFDLEEGMKINVVGRVQIYEPSGSIPLLLRRLSRMVLVHSPSSLSSFVKNLLLKATLMIVISNLFLILSRKLGLSLVLVVRLFGTLLQRLVVVFQV